MGRNWRNDDERVIVTKDMKLYQRYGNGSAWEWHRLELPEGTELRVQTRTSFNGEYTCYYYKTKKGRIRPCYTRNDEQVAQPAAEAPKAAAEKTVDVVLYFGSKLSPYSSYSEKCKVHSLEALYEVATHKFVRGVHKEVIAMLDTCGHPHMFRVCVHRGRICIDNGWDFFHVDRRSRITPQLAAKNGLGMIDVNPFVD